MNLLLNFMYYIYVKHFEYCTNNFFFIVRLNHKEFYFSLSLVLFITCNHKEICQSCSNTTPSYPPPSPHTRA